MARRLAGGCPEGSVRGTSCRVLFPEPSGEGPPMLLGALLEVVMNWLRRWVQS